jgi:hypothetical protein
MKKSKSKQIDIQWAEPESFALAFQQTTDGERMVREQAQSQADQQHAEQQQTTFE